MNFDELRESIKKKEQKDKEREQGAFDQVKMDLINEVEKMFEKMKKNGYRCYNHYYWGHVFSTREWVRMKKEIETHYSNNIKFSITSGSDGGKMITVKVLDKPFKGLTLWVKELLR